MERLLTLEDIADAFQVTRKYARDRLIKRDGFPRPVLISNEVKRWRPADIEKFIAGQVEVADVGE